MKIYLKSSSDIKNFFPQIPNIVQNVRKMHCMHFSMFYLGDLATCTEELEIWRLVQKSWRFGDLYRRVGDSVCIREISGYLGELA